ncbi:MAG: type II toxin-antitoxin system HicB family antitoxin [Bacteroidia bacterium]|nr:type II toxin-antitoxin system HicB family antitoxin [Bacteroidia bacterium]
MKKNYQFTAQIIKDKDTGLYVGIIPDIPGAHTQAESLDELYKNLEEVLKLCLKELREEELNQLPQTVK